MQAGGFGGLSVVAGLWSNCDLRNGSHGISGIAHMVGMLPCRGADSLGRKGWDGDEEELSFV